MKIAIFGATGRVGASAAAQAHKAGHNVVMHARTEEKAAELKAYGKVVVGAIDAPHVLAKVMDGADAVLCTLGTTNRKPNTVLSDITLGLIQAMEKQGVERFVCVTSLGCGGSIAQVSGRLMRWIIRSLAKEIWADKDRQEHRIMDSDLDYLIVRPGGLSKKPPIGTTTAKSETEPLPKKQMIPIDDVAAYCIAECVCPSTSRQAVSLVSM